MRGHASSAHSLQPSRTRPPRAKFVVRPCPRECGFPRAGHTAELVKAERARRSVSVFAHSNALTSELSDALKAANVRHEPVQLSEAYGEALNAQPSDSAPPHWG